MNAQQAIRAIPDNLRGIDASAMLRDYASQVRRAVKAAPAGVVQKTYGLSQAIKTADELDKEATRFAVYARITRPSVDYSRLQTLVGRAVQEVYSIDGQVKVFDVADANFVPDLIRSAKDLPKNLVDWAAPVIVIVVVLAAVVIVFKVT